MTPPSIQRFLRPPDSHSLFAFYRPTDVSPIGCCGPYLLCYGFGGAMFVQPNANSKFTCSTAQKTPPLFLSSQPTNSEEERRDFELDATVGGMDRGERREHKKKKKGQTWSSLSITVHGAINFRRRRRYCFFLCRSIFAICRRRPRAALRRPPSHRTHHHPQWASVHLIKLDIFLSRKFLLSFTFPSHPSFLFAQLPCTTQL